MTHPLEPNPAAPGSPVLPLQLLQPLDASHPFSTPASSGGPHQRLIVSPDPGVGAEVDLRPTRLLISKEGQIRSIWPVHLAGWQQLGWQLLSTASGGDEPVPVDTGDNAPELVDGLDLEPEQPAATDPAPTPDEPTPPDDPLETTTDGGEALLASQPTDFQAMTKAQIAEFCSTVYGVELDGSQTKAELVEQAMALEAQASGTPAEDLADLELGDALL